MVYEHMQCNPTCHTIIHPNKGDGYRAVTTCNDMAHSCLHVNNGSPDLIEENKINVVVCAICPFS